MKKNIFFFSTLFLLCFPVFAQGETGFSVAKLCQMGLCVFGGPGDVERLGFILMNFLAGTIVFAAVLGFMIGGFYMVLSGGVEARVAKGKNILIASVSGLLLVFSSVLIVRLISALIYSAGT